MSLGHVLGDVEKAKIIVTTKSIGKTINTVGVLNRSTAEQSGVDGSTCSVVNVQYNPSSLTIQANADPVAYAALHQSTTTGVINQSTRPPQVTLTVELIFDAMNPHDAFLVDRFRPSVGDAVHRSENQKIKSRGGYTVQHETNALMALMLKPDVDKVTFSWGKTSFTGVVTEIESRYLMFSVSGKPIRSKVTMRISQEIGAIKSETERWRTAFKEKFVSSQEFTDSAGGNAVLNLP